MASSISAAILTAIDFRNQQRPLVFCNSSTINSGFVIQSKWTFLQPRMEEENLQFSQQPRLYFLYIGQQKVNKLIFKSESILGFLNAGLSLCYGAKNKKNKNGKISTTAFMFIFRVDAGEFSLIQSEVRNVLSKAKAAGVLRMVFHDAGTYDIDDNSGGMNGSIIYELDRPENAGLKKPFKILEKAKKEIDQSLKVSWADLIAVAGAEAVALCGGPAIPVRLGRMDARIPDPEGKLPEESLDASNLKSCFLKKGFCTQELVALSGAHTLGSKGFGNPVAFDNTYFKILIDRPWKTSGMASMIGLPSDRALVEDNECLKWIEVYAGDELKFFDDFRNAYNKLVNSGAMWKSA